MGFYFVSFFLHHTARQLKISLFIIKRSKLRNQSNEAYSSISRSIIRRSANYLQLVCLFDMLKDNKEF